jgi:cobalamin biosynthesis Mg chelatase CobN
MFKILYRKMRLRTLLIFILLAGGLFQCYASESFQDSVKRVTVKITATEKSRALNFDSLLDSRQAEMEKASASSSPSKSFRRNYSSTEKVTSENTSSPEKEARQQGSASRPKKRVVEKPQESQSATVQNHSENDHKEEITDDSESSASTSSNIKTSRAYLWVGIMLMVVGIVLGILFGKTAFLISLAGIVFVVIGYVV